MKKPLMILGILLAFSAAGIQAKSSKDAIDYNASRSNNTNSKIDNSNGAGNTPVNAQDWNSTRSNKTSKTTIKPIKTNKKKKFDKSKG